MLLKKWEKSYISERPKSKEIFVKESCIVDVFNDAEVIVWATKKSDITTKKWLVEPDIIQEGRKAVWNGV